MKKILIVGGVAGGATTAARLRRLSEKDDIILFERGEYISFANCGLPYYIGEVITSRDKLLLQTVPGMSKRFGLDIRNLSEVTRIDRNRKVVEVMKVDTGETYEESYDVLVLSPGSKPIVPPIPGLKEANNVFTLRNVPDTDRIKSYVDEQKPKHVTVIGGGFIGVEMAENLRDLGIEVSLIELGNQVLGPIDFEMASIVHTEMKKHGVELILEDGVQSFKNEGRTVVTNSGREVQTDMIVLAIGVVPESNLAREAGLETGLRGAIKVNEHMQTSDEHIYAVGDAIEVRDYVQGVESYVPLAWPANRQGRLVADHINDKPARYTGSLGSSIVKVFDLTVAATGNNEKWLQRLGVKYEVAHVHPANHAGYYPGASQMTLKLIFDGETGRIFGAQAVGKDGIDKRIDVLATAIKGNLTVFDLPDLELCYAPPYSSAKDPVNMAGYVATNMIDGMVDTIQWHEIDERIAAGATLIDVRNDSEFERGKIAGSVNIPVNDLRDRLDEVPRDKELYVTCQVGFRGYLAARILMENGFKVKNLDGGYKLYNDVFRNK